MNGRHLEFENGRGDDDVQAVVRLSGHAAPLALHTTALHASRSPSRARKYRGDRTGFTTKSAGAPQWYGRIRPFQGLRTFMAGDLAVAIMTQTRRRYIRIISASSSPARPHDHYRNLDMLTHRIRALPN